MKISDSTYNLTLDSAGRSFGGSATFVSIGISVFVLYGITFASSPAKSAGSGDYFTISESASMFEISYISI